MKRNNAIKMRFLVHKSFFPDISHILSFFLLFCISILAKTKNIVYVCVYCMYVHVQPHGHDIAIIFVNILLCSLKYGTYFHFDNYQLLFFSSKQNLLFSSLKLDFRVLGLSHNNNYQFYYKNNYDLCFFCCYFFRLDII